MGQFMWRKLGETVRRAGFKDKPSPMEEIRLRKQNVDEIPRTRIDVWLGDMLDV